MTNSRSALMHRIAGHACKVGVVGLGYVGLPLIVEVARSGYNAIGFDVNDRVVDSINAGRSHIRDVSEEDLAAFVRSGHLTATSDFAQLASCDVIVICVPTPLNKLHDPDLSYVVAAANAVQKTLRPEQLVVLESTTYPGTTRDVVLPILAESGLEVGKDFFLCFSPERVDPGNPVWHVRNTPRLLGGITPTCTEVGLAFYRNVIETVIPVKSAEVAELAKVYENTFRMVNIALANELTLVCSRLGLDVWDVIEAASSKPFGFMPFTPGPGVGGHCIPIDPHYLSWRLESLDFKARMIELASEINSRMPAFVVELVSNALNDECRAVRGSRVLILGVAYKRDVGDLRESPALEIIRLLMEKGAEIHYHDPFCPVIKPEGPLSDLSAPLENVALTDQVLEEANAVVIVTDHNGIDYERVAEKARLVIDTRGVMRGRQGRARIVGLSGQTTRATSATALPGLQAALSAA